MKIGFIGAGNMGEAYISALCYENDVSFCEVNQERTAYIQKKYNVEAVDNEKDLIENSDYIIIAVKPQNMEETLKCMREVEMKEKVFISIAAGVKIEKIENIIGADKKIARVMPNTPVLIKKGISAVSFNESIESEKEKEIIIKILATTGKVIEVEEKYIDIVTGISGSGPAYVFLLVNSLAEGGVRMGLPKKIALELAVETFIGSAEMIKQTGKHPEELKDMVTSPGGTTAAALFEMEDAGVRRTMIKAVEAAVLRAEKLGK